MKSPLAKSKPHVPRVDPAWLDRIQEAPITVGYPVVDGHFHLWDFSDPPYFGDSYRRDALAAGIASSVYVECSMAYRDDGPEREKVIGEVEFACEQARIHTTPDFRVAEAIVGAADIRLGADIAPVLEQMIAASEGRLRGIRVRAATNDDPAVSYGASAPPPELLGQPASRKALSVLKGLGLSLDVYLFHTQLDDIIRLAQAIPDLPIVLNHTGTPIGAGTYAKRGDEVLTLWRKGIKALAPFENVSVKIGGFAISRVNLVVRGDRADPPRSLELAEIFEPWMDHCLNSLGPERCLYGSNFPVEKTAMSLTSQVNAMKRLTGKLTPDEAAAVMGGTARRVYKLER